MTVPLLRFTSIQHLEGVKDPGGLAPKSRFIAAEPIKREIGKVGETQKAAGELDSGSVGFQPRVGKRFSVADSTGRSCVAAGGFGPTENRVNYLTGIRKQLAVLPIVMQLPSLNLEQYVAQASLTKICSGKGSCKQFRPEESRL